MTIGSIMSKLLANTKWNQGRNQTSIQEEANLPSLVYLVLTSLPLLSPLSPSSPTVPHLPSLNVSAEAVSVTHI